MTQKINLIVTSVTSGKRLDQIIALLEPSISRSQAKILIEQNCVFVDGTLMMKPKQILSSGAHIIIEKPIPKKLELIPQEVGLCILYEDDELAVIEKPEGISVHPSHTEQGATLVHGLLHSLHSLSNIGGIERPGIVHRLDKGTSGILVISKTDATHMALSSQFKTHSIERRYQALVYGDMSRIGMSGYIETFFGRHPKHRKKMTGKLNHGRKASTFWKILKHFEWITLVECRLETGRTHQIRVHLSEKGFSVVGDLLYGDHERFARQILKKNEKLGKACLALKHQCLHAYYLGFKHPITGKTMHFESRLPERFKEILKILEHD